MKRSQVYFALTLASLLTVASCNKPSKKTRKSSSFSEPSSETTSRTTTDPTTSTTTAVSSQTSAIPTTTSSPTSTQPTSVVPVSSSSSSSASTTPIPSSSSQPIPVPPEEYTVIETFSRRMPAEFEQCAMVTMCYPNNMPLSVYKTISDDNQILLLCNPSGSGSSRINQAKSELSSVGSNLDHFTFLDMDLDRDDYYWCRDFSPFYVFREKTLGIVDFTYNRSDRSEQNAVPGKLATYFGMSSSKMSLTHTGGNLMQDGRGTAFSDDLVIQENNHNESKVRSEMETYTGTNNYVITIDPQGDYIAHIDCWAKIVAPDKIIVAKLPQSDSRYLDYEQVATELGNLDCIYGYKYRIYRVEEPGGETIAPYTNSLIANKHVYVPLGENSTYNQKALQVYEDALPGYTVHGVQGYNFNQDDCFLNTDALHCRTHEIPDAKMLFIDSREVYRGNVEYQSEYLIKTNVVSYAGGNIEQNVVKIKYSINNSAFITSQMSQYLDTTNYTFKFTGLNHGDDVRYYIEATDSLSNSSVDPTCGESDPHHFIVN